MKIISLLIKPDSGQASICGVNNKGHREEYLSNFSCTIETPALYENLTGYDNIEFIRDINKVSKEYMNEILEFVNVGKMIKEKVKNYSLGMKQRLGLGMALLTSPKLLILDEPTNGLDPDGSMEFRKLLIQLAKEKDMAILISSHILSELDNICEKILFLKNGKILKSDVKTIRANNKKVILSCENSDKLFEEYNKMDNINSVIKINSNKICLKFRNENLKDILDNIVKRRDEYTDIEISSDDIKDIYTSIYGGD